MLGRDVGLRLRKLRLRLLRRYLVIPRIDLRQHLARASRTGSHPR